MPWTTKDAAAFLDIGERTIFRWIKSGRIRSIKIGAKLRIPDSVVRDIAERGLSTAGESMQTLRIPG